MAIRRYVTVKGSFHEALFNKDAARIAAEIKVNGWVRGRSDGSIEACFEGRRKAVEAMISWCFVGQRLARVEEVVVRHKRYCGSLHGFRIMSARDGEGRGDEVRYVDSWRGSTASWRSYG
jgi:acylphosphatase